MNKKYMDFVPAGPQSRAVARGGASKTAVVKKVVKKTAVAKKPASANKIQRKASPEVVREEVVLQEDILETGAETFSLKKEPRYGVVENYRPKFVKTEVAKRPLSRGHFVAQKSELAEAKAVKVAAKKVGEPAKPVENPVEKSEKPEKKADDKAKMKIPKSPFINQGKIEKRPLSKNIYERTIKSTEEKPTGPVKIISQPEKDSKVGRVVAIILAIILGAAAGTVAFLLLPK
ncbi:hypothetical protein IJJ53_02965 [Candidatus Saccharibacteria bacterium]|nr:hypothetical protein [Candidatus Saccharibacteria bacterium]